MTPIPPEQEIGQGFVVRGIKACRAQLALQQGERKRVGLVPTMGAFHDGHVALMRKARRECDYVVVSLFINPTQFNDPRDLEAYPRDEGRDAEIAYAAGVDMLFAPSARSMYGDQAHVEVHVPDVSERLEGASRGAAHFRGVATVVTKLLNIVQPAAAYFGEKDAQQLVVIRRMVRDLNIPVEIASVDTIREKDGLAMSSRNALLSPADRKRASTMFAALCAVERGVSGGEHRTQSLLADGRRELAVDEIDYFEIVDGETFAPLEEVNQRARGVIAARVGGVRLIDNAHLGAAAALATIRVGSGSVTRVVRG